MPYFEGTPTKISDLIINGQIQAESPAGGHSISYLIWRKSEDNIPDEKLKIASDFINLVINNDYSENLLTQIASDLKIEEFLNYLKQIVQDCTPSELYAYLHYFPTERLGVMVLSQEKSELDSEHLSNYQLEVLDSINKRTFMSDEDYDKAYKAFGL